MIKLLKLIFLFIIFLSACNGNKEKENDSSNFEKAEIKSDLAYSATSDAKSISYDAVASSPDQCKDILSQGIMQIYKFTRRKDYIEAVRKAITMSDEEIKRNQSSHDASANIGIKLLRFGADYSDESDEFSSIKRKYTDNSSLDISDHDLLEIERRIADPTLVQAWLDCMGNTKNGLTYKITGDLANEFSVQIQYIPSSGFEPRKIKLSNFTYTGGITPIAPSNFKNGMQITQFSTITQKFKRKSNSIASISIDSRLKPLSIYIDRIIQQPTKPDSIEVWTRTDPNGIEYKQVFISNTPECLDCSNKPPVIFSKIETLDAKEARIYDVKRNCSGAGCGWNYSAAPDGYSIVFHILQSGNQFWFERRIGGPACTEINIAYYEVKRKVPKT